MTAQYASDAANRRLRKALRELALATRKEHQVFLKFGERINDLDVAVTQLETSCRKYRASLGRISTSKLKRRSLRLAEIMATVKP